jgi:hypothetical protein
MILLDKYRIRELIHVFYGDILFDSQRLIFQYVCANGSIFVEHCVPAQSCMHSNLEALIEYLQLSLNTDVAKKHAANKKIQE